LILRGKDQAGGPDYLQQRVVVLALDHDQAAWAAAGSTIA
jgi:hypothetical protein